jgi:hypothetical protein
MTTMNGKYLISTLLVISPLLYLDILTAFCANCSCFSIDTNHTTSIFSFFICRYRLSLCFSTILLQHKLRFCPICFMCFLQLVECPLRNLFFIRPAVHLFALLCYYLLVYTFLVYLFLLFSVIILIIHGLLSCYICLPVFIYNNGTFSFILTFLQLNQLITPIFILLFNSCYFNHYQYPMTVLYFSCFFDRDSYFCYQ